MPEFIEIPATKSSISKRRRLFGIGVNDAPYLTSSTNVPSSKMIRCPFYRRWTNMLARCYSSKYHEKFPTYIECTVTDEWFTFSIFRLWMENQDWNGMELDKDILVPGNKVYAPEYCVFIPKSLNKLLTDSRAKRGDFPIGVCFDSREKKFRATCRVNSKKNHLGHFSTPEAASLAYRQFKSSLIVEAADRYPKLKEGLLVHADRYLNGEVE